jgi:hypothetical protein
MGLVHPRKPDRHWHQNLICLGSTRLDFCFGDGFKRSAHFGAPCAFGATRGPTGAANPCMIGLDDCFGGEVRVVFMVSFDAFGIRFSYVDVVMLPRRVAAGHSPSR